MVTANIAIISKYYILKCCFEKIINLYLTGKTSQIQMWLNINIIIINSNVIGMLKKVKAFVINKSIRQSISADASISEFGVSIAEIN